jgi:hypothetical protein
VLFDTLVHLTVCCDTLSQLRYAFSHSTTLWLGGVVKYRDNLAEAYLSLIGLMRSPIITNPTRRSAETLVTMLEAELSQTLAPEKRLDTRPKDQPKTQNAA